MTKKVAILASDGCLLSGVAGPMDMFIQAGVFWQMLHGEDANPLFDVSILTMDGKPATTLNDVSITPHGAANMHDRFDLVIVPSQGISYQIQDAAFFERVKWVKACHEQGSHVASICTGAFTLAETGLLDGKAATTHWGAAVEFRKRYPQVNLDTDKMLTDSETIFCGAGVTADQSLSLYLIYKYFGRQIAVQCSKCTLVDFDRDNQTPFAAFVPFKNHQDKEVLHIQVFIEQNYPKSLSLEHILEQSGMSARNGNRRFKSATGFTITQYIQLVRTEAAKRLIEEKTLPFSEIAVQVGYENVNFFRTVFKKFTGISPSVYKQKFCY